MRRSMVLLAVVMVASLSAVVAVGAWSPAHARDGGPPKTVLFDGERELQRGKLGTYCWTYPGGGVCQDAILAFPADAPRVRAGSELHVRIFKPQRPEEFSITAYRKLDENGYPAGPARELAVTLRPVERNGRTVAWDAFFEVNRPDRHYYLSAFGVWEEGDASYTFHVKTRS